MAHGERALLSALERYLSAAESRFLPEAYGDSGADPGELSDIHRRMLTYLGYRPTAAEEIASDA